MKYISIFLLVIISVSICNAISGLPPNIIENTAQINIGDSKGSGFFLVDSLDAVYFITAKHVIVKSVDGKKITFYNTEMKVFWYPYDAESDNQDSIYINVLHLYNNNDIYISSQDAIAFKIGKFIIINDKLKIEYTAGVNGFSTNKLVRTLKDTVVNLYEDCCIGNEVLLIGYPIALGLSKSAQYNFSRPLLRKGWIAGKNKSIKTLVIDCPSYGGNSGSPIFERIDSVSASSYKLVGICTEFIPYDETWFDNKGRAIHSQRSNSGYSIVLSMDHVLDLIYKKISKE